MCPVLHDANSGWQGHGITGPHQSQNKAQLWGPVFTSAFSPTGAGAEGQQLQRAKHVLHRGEWGQSAVVQGLATGGCFQASLRLRALRSRCGMGQPSCWFAWTWVGTYSGGAGAEAAARALGCLWERHEWLL